MLKLKNTLFWIFVILAVAVGVYAYFGIKQNKKPNALALAQLPDSCLIYVKTDDFFALNKKIRSQSLIADKLKLFADVSLFCVQLQEFDSLFSSHELLKEELSGNPVHLALYGKNANWLAGFNMKQLGNQDEIADGLGKTLNAKKEEAFVFSFKLSNKEKLYYSINKGVTLISNDKRLIARALNTNCNRLVNNEAFKNSENILNDDNTLSVFVNHGVCAAYKFMGLLNFNILSKKGFLAGQVEIEHSAIKANGFMNADSSEMLHVLENEESQSPQKLMLVLPHNMVAFRAFGFGSYSNIFSKLFRNNAPANGNFWKASNEAAMYNLHKEFGSNIGNHLLIFETRVNDLGYVAAELIDTAKAAAQLRFMCDTLFEEKSGHIYALRRESEALRLFAPLVLNETNFACIYGSFILFSENRDDLRNLTQNLQDGLFAINNQSFNYYRSQNFPDEYNYLFYSSPNNYRNNIGAFVRLKPLGLKDPYENMRHFSFSLTNNASAFKFRLHIMNEAESNAQEQNVLWTLNLDTVSSMKACRFVNHLTSENEIVVQDDAGNLYLVNAKGNIIWKKNIGEKICSQIYRVDAFKNNKFQMLFNTPGRIYLIDRNGNNVKGFPVNLPAEATSEICVMDYDNDKNYRIFIACANRCVYNYNILGQTQDGFVPVKTEHDVALPLQYVKVGLSDYLVALDKEGMIYIFSRKGAVRIKLKNRTLANCGAFYVDATNNRANTNIVCVDDKSGLINKISFTDKRELLRLNMDHGSADVKFFLVDDDRNMDIVITRGTGIQTFNFNGDLLFEKDLGTELMNTIYFSNESHSFYSSLNTQKNELTVYDDLKQKIKKIRACAMPLVCTLFKDSKEFLLVTNGRQLSCVPLD